MLLWYGFAGVVNDWPDSGLTPSWVSWGPLDPQAPVAPQPTIVNRGTGLYGFQFDPELSGDHDGLIDLGAVAADDGRFIYLQLTRESSRIITDLPAMGAVYVTG